MKSEIQKTVVIDAATIFPGRGGAGGGIWSYASNLLLELDAALDNASTEISFICLVNTDFSLPLRNIVVKRISADLRKFPLRLVYVHIYLPVYVLWKNAVLHKLYFEVPFFSFSKTMVTIHDCMSSFYKRKKYTSESFSRRLQGIYFDAINERAVRKSHLICTPSGFIKQEVTENYKIAPEKLVVTHLATSMKPEVMKPDGNGSYTPGRTEINIYCIAAFHSHKGHLRLIDVFEEMSGRHNVPANLIFRGHIHDHDYYNRILKRIDKSALKDRIRFIEYDRASLVNEIYQQADWVVLLSEYEGFGLPIIEAQANGIPVICSNIPVFREIGADSVLYLDSEWSLAQQGDKMYEYITDNARKEKVVEAGYVNIGRYSWKKFAQQMLKVYREI